MREVKTQTPPGMPSSAGTSNASSARIATSSTAASSAGRTSGSVTRRTTDGRRAPLAKADSSSDGSIALNAAAISRNTTGTRCSPSTKIIPPIPNTFSAPSPAIGSSRRLTRPVRGLARKIQEIV